ncbi:MAG: hypothetical protein ACRDV1_14340, partial [Actinomycetes bacterium]
MRRLLRTTRLTLVVVALSAVMTLAAAVALGGPAEDTARPGPVEPAALERLGSSDLAGAIGTLQRRLRARPEDRRAWSTLALGYVEQARVTA